MCANKIFIFGHVTASSKSAAVYQISSKSYDFAFSYGDLTIFISNFSYPVIVLKYASCQRYITDKSEEIW